MNEQFLKALFDRNCPSEVHADGTQMFYIDLHCVEIQVYAKHNEDGSWEVVGFTLIL